VAKIQLLHCLQHLLLLSRYADPISGLVLSRVHLDFGVKASTKREAGREGRGTEKVQRLELDERTGGAAAITSRGKMIRLRAKVKGQGSATKPPRGMSARIESALNGAGEELAASGTAYPAPTEEGTEATMKGHLKRVPDPAAVIAVGQGKQECVCH
jgi:hypothetical protein